PLGRTMMLAHAGEIVRLPDGRSAQLGSQPGPGGASIAAAALVDFRLEWGLPVWAYDVLGARVERRIWMAHRQNTVYVSYDVLSSDAIRFEFEPWIRFRPHDGALDAHAA